MDTRVSTFRGTVTFFFTPRFFLLAVGVLFGRVAEMDLAGALQVNPEAYEDYLKDISHL